MEPDASVNSLAIEDFRLDAGTILVLTFDLDRDHGLCLEWFLDDSERERASRYVDAIHRSRFIAARAALRLVLGVVLGERPGAIQFRFNRNGKPYLAEPVKPIQFNLSHASQRALIALTLEREIGIDIERVRSVDPVALAERCFSKVERASLSELGGGEQLEAFFRGWTRKESYVKAVGLGFSYPLDAFDMSLEDSTENAFLRDRSVGLAPMRSWKTCSLLAPEGFFAALTYEGAECRLQRRETSLAALVQLGRES